MREIKFRGWDRQNKKLLVPMTWSEHLLFDLEMDVWDVRSNYTSGPLPKDRYVLQQYTGIRDKNGKEIYERDRVKTPAGIGIVEYIEGCWYIQWDAEGMTTLHDTPLDMREVIGNIYENPELLTKNN